MKLRKRRKFADKKKRIMYFSLFFMLLFITVGYAYLSATLSINGHTEIAANSWNIHFENLSITEGSVTASTPAVINANTTSINYSVLLKTPGDFYEFSVDIVNSGTIPGVLSLTNVQGISSAAEPYLETSIKYTNGLDVQPNDLLNPNSSKRIIVRVGYKEDINTLPEENIPLDLIFNVNYGQTNEIEVRTGSLLQDLFTAGNTCITKYEGNVTDQVGQTVAATNVYFDNCADKRNIIFGGFCWQVLRTTETGGLKMMYNGEPVNGKCESTRGDHKGVISSPNDENTSMADAHLFGRSITYNINSEEFQLLDVFEGEWTNNNYQDFVGSYTCMSDNDTCTEAYWIGVNYYSNKGNTTKLTVTDTNYAQVGTSGFSVTPSSKLFNGFGYKYPLNTEVYYNDLFSRNIIISDDFTYDPIANQYTLSGNVENLTLANSNKSVLNNKHYSCFNVVNPFTVYNTCNRLAYIYYASSSRFYLVYLYNGDGIQDFLNRNLYDYTNINVIDSTIKSYIEIWYRDNLSYYTNKLDDNVYCNNKSISDEGGFNPNGGDITKQFTFVGETTSSDLTCSNLTDQFAVSNNKAKNKYPVGLITSAEYYNMDDSLLKKSNPYWTMTPSKLESLNGNAVGIYINSEGVASLVSSSVNGVRPVISLKEYVRIVGGSGSETDPWLVE